jgi:hypothetical protein
MLRRVLDVPPIRALARAVREGLVRAYRPIHRRRGYLCDRQIVFILSHMRAGSSMLTRVLSTHPEVAAIGQIGEMHRVYASRSDLDDMTIWLEFLNRRKLASAGFVLDKLLHNRLLPNPKLLAEARIKCVFLVREPEASIKSMVTKMRRLEMFGKPELAAEYYENRLRRLVVYADAASPELALTLDYSELVENPAVTLGHLQRFLGLASDLSPNYEVNEEIRQYGRGASTHLAGGVIRRVREDYGVELPLEVMERTRQTYEEASAALRQRTFVTPTVSELE